MIRRTIAPAVMAEGLTCESLASACAQLVSRNAKIDGEPSDKVLFEQAQRAIEKSNCPEARTGWRSSLMITQIRTMCLVPRFP